MPSFVVTVVALELSLRWDTGGLLVSIAILVRFPESDSRHQPHRIVGGLEDLIETGFGLEGIPPLVVKTRLGLVRSCKRRTVLPVHSFPDGREQLFSGC